MFNELLLASQSVQALMTLLKATKGLSNYNEIVAAVAEVNSKLMQAYAVALGSQEKQSALAAKVQELEKECMRLKEWNAEKEIYERRPIASDVFAYVSKTHVGDLKNAHKFCCNCFDKTIKSTLQKGIGTPITLICPNGCPPLKFISYIKTLKT